MSYKIIFTKDADLDLIEIHNYIAQDNPSRALSFIEEILSAIAKLSDNPFLGTKISDGRKLSYANYIVLYKVLSEKKELNIYCISNTAQLTKYQDFL